MRRITEDGPGVGAKRFIDGDNLHTAKRGASDRDAGGRAAEWKESAGASADCCDIGASIGGAASEKVDLQNQEQARRARWRSIVFEQVARAVRRNVTGDSHSVN